MVVIFQLTSESQESELESITEFLADHWCALIFLTLLNTVANAWIRKEKKKPPSYMTSSARVSFLLIPFGIMLVRSHNLRARVEDLLLPRSAILYAMVQCLGYDLLNFWVDHGPK